jgi:hypothetical protein
MEVSTCSKTRGTFGLRIELPSNRQESRILLFYSRKSSEGSAEERVPQILPKQNGFHVRKYFPESSIVHPRGHKKILKWTAVESRPSYPPIEFSLYSPNVSAVFAISIRI